MRIEERVAERIISKCEAALAEMPSYEKLAKMSEAIDAEDAGEGSAPIDLRARMAARVLLGERSALEACVALWRREKIAVAAALGAEAASPPEKLP